MITNHCLYYKNSNEYIYICVYAAAGGVRFARGAHAEPAQASMQTARASGTEPLLRVMVEAAEPAAVDHWSSHLADLAAAELNGV